MPDTTQAIPRNIVVSRQREPEPPIKNLGGARPGVYTLQLAVAAQDYAVWRPLGYPVRALTFITPGNSFNSGANSDSVYLDTEDISGIVAGSTPSSTSGMIELPPGVMLTIEETDPGWYHATSPTAGQRLFVIFGGPHAIPKPISPTEAPAPTSK